MEKRRVERKDKGNGQLLAELTKASIRIIGQMPGKVNTDPKQKRRLRGPPEVVLGAVEKLLPTQDLGYDATASPLFPGDLR